MNINQLGNMILRLLMRKAVNKGINTGLKKAGQMRQKPSAPPAARAEPPEPGEGLTREQVRAQRRARRAAREERNQ